MARIRSLHATQWNDDDFLECSPFARLLALALRNFADDNGIFEWKPGQIKRNCLPADTCDVKPLLRELIEHKQVMQFTVDGRGYGAIRNFRQWQRPKKPNSLYPVTDEVRKYTKFETGGGSELEQVESDTSSELDDVQEGVSSVKPLADVGCRRKEVGGRRDTSSLRSDVCAEPSQARASAPEPPSEMELPAFLDRRPKPGPKPPPEPAVVSLPTNVAGAEVGVSQAQIDDYAATYPGVDVPQQLREMRRWLIDNPAKRKTAKGMGRFINSWLSKEQDHGTNSPRSPGAPSRSTGSGVFFEACLNSVRSEADSSDGCGDHGSPRGTIGILPPRHPDPGPGEDEAGDLRRRSARSI